MPSEVFEILGKALRPEATRETKVKYLNKKIEQYNFFNETSEKEIRRHRKRLKTNNIYLKQLRIELDALTPAVEKAEHSICDICANYSVSQGGTLESCNAFIDLQTKFTREITKPYIEARMTGAANHCKEFKKL